MNKQIDGWIDRETIQWQWVGMDHYWVSSHSTLFSLSPTLSLLSATTVVYLFLLHLQVNSEAPKPQADFNKHFCR